jgi:hypothetical protein
MATSVALTTEICRQTHSKIVRTRKGLPKFRCSELHKELYIKWQQTACACVTLLNQVHTQVDRTQHLDSVIPVPFY